MAVASARRSVHDLMLAVTSDNEIVQKYALEDATIENGCVCVAEGSHLTEPLRQRLVKVKNGRPEFVQLQKSVWDRMAQDKSAEFQRRQYDFQPLEVKRGTLVLFHGNLLHASGANWSGKGRMSYIFTVIDGSLDNPEDAYIKPAGEEFAYL